MTSGNDHHSAPGTKPHRADRIAPELSICLLASGSKGNALYVSDGTTAVLVDAGLSGVEIERRLHARGLSARHLDAIVVSHEHSDHIGAVGVLSRRYDLPVFISQPTLKALPARTRPQRLHRFECGFDFSIKSLRVHPFSLPHDAADAAGFTIGSKGLKIGIATDLGTATTVVKTHLRDCALLVIEANHDPRMLAEGPYPWPLKQRIQSRTGHLSNRDSCRLLRELYHRQLRHVILAHLSETNNTPEKALAEIGTALPDARVSLSVGRQDRCGALIRLAVRP
jgi:phosphoribosyl 1,2-cyclic phosphodiesterase